MNKVKYGLRNSHYAVITESNGFVTFGTPKALPGSVNLVLNASGDPVTFNADDGVYYEDYTNNGYEGTLELALIPDSFKVDVLGYKIDSNGAVIENSDAKSKKFALMYEFDGDANKVRHVNYYVSASRPNIEGSTKTQTKEPKTETLNITARPAPDTLNVHAKLDQGKVGYDTFFTAVYLEDSVINTVAVNTASFSKAAPLDITVDSTSTDGTNTVKNVMLDGSSIAGIYLTVTGSDVAIDSPYLATLENGTHTITVEFEKGNAVTVTLTVAA
jgi:phi13 family phage major tail protein